MRDEASANDFPNQRRQVWRDLHDRRCILYIFTHAHTHTPGHTPDTRVHKHLRVYTTHVCFFMHTRIQTSAKYDYLINTHAHTHTRTHTHRALSRRRIQNTVQKSTKAHSVRHHTTHRVHAAIKVFAQALAVLFQVDDAVGERLHVEHVDL